MESLKRVFLFVIIGFFLINFSSAGLFDPNSEIEFYEESKNGKYGYYEINDTDFWFFNNKPVKTIELLENDYSVFTAWNIKEYNVFRPTKLFDKTNYLDKEQEKDRSSAISSELHLYREWKIKTRTISDIECLTYETSVNGTQACSEYQDNSYYEEYEEWSDWIVYNFQTVQDGLYQTKTIVTRDRQGTGTIDWVDENEGWDLSEWATWWDNDWEFKREISGLDGNISALFSITYDANMKADFGDLRFLDNATELIELNYTIESFISSTSVVIRVNNLGASSIYMYYGNASVSTTGSASNTHFNPVSYYYLDETSGQVIDAIGINNGTNSATRGVDGYINNTYSFNGANEYADFGTMGNLGSSMTSGISFSLWVKTTTTTADAIFGTLVSNEDIRLRINLDPTNGATVSTGKLTIFMRGNAIIRGGVNSNTGITDGNWHHLLIVADPNNAGSTRLLIWVDGVSQTIAYQDGNNNQITAFDNFAVPFTIGAFNNNGAQQQFFDGEIDEFGIYNYLLDNTDAARLSTYTEPTFIVGVEEQNIGVKTTLISPENNENILSNTINFNFTSTPTDTNLTNVTLYIWNSTGLVDTNFTTLSGNESINTTLINTLVDGMYKWNAETCGDGVECSFASSNNSFIVHVTPITIEISEPNGTIPYILLGDNQTLTWQLTEPGENLSEHVTNCSFTYNSVVTYLPLNTCIVTNTTEFEYINGVNTLTFNTTDFFNLTSSQTTTWEYTIIELNQTFEENITEGELDDFSLLLNISDSSSLEDATFSYNGTNYTTTIIFSSGLYLIESMIVSPTVDEDTNFSFNFFFIVDGINYSTTVNQQLVVNSLFSVCGGISNDTLLNMSLVDEESGLSITGNIEIIAEIVSQSSGESVGTINNTFSNVKYGAICFTPANLLPSYYLNTEIKYSSSGYVPELYYIQNSDMVDYPRNLTLFDLNQTDSTEFVITFQNDAFILVEGAIIQLQRKYIGENVFKTVEAPITADGGKAIVHIDLNTNIYRVSVVKDGELLKFFSDIIFSCENELAGECTEQLRGDVNPNNDVPIENLLDFAYSVSVSDENNTVTVLFAIPSGTPSSINVLLTQIDMFGNSTSCNTTVITSAGSITCDFIDTIEKSILQLTISKDGTQLAITNYGVDPELDMDGMNFFIVFLFLISLVGMAIASPEWMMIIGVMVFMISGTLLLLQGMSLAMGLGAMAWLVVVVIIIILKMAKQEDR